MSKNAYVAALALIICVASGVACQEQSFAPSTSTPEPTAMPATPTSEPTTMPATPTPDATATVTPTQEPQQITWYSFFGGQKHGVWDADTIQRYYDSNNAQLIRDATALYAQPVPLDDLDEQLTSNPPPDVITGFIGGGSLTRYVKAGALADLSDLWAEEGWEDDYPESVATLATVDGQRYFVPQAVQWNPVWYRTDVFDEAGVSPPETWEALLALCDELNAAGYTPFTVAARTWTPPAARWFTILNLRINGPAYHDRLMRGEEAFDDSRVRTVFEHWQQLLEHNCFAEDAAQNNYRNALRDIVSGDAAMYNIGEWLFEGLDADDAANLDFFRFPVINPDVPNGEIALVYGGYMPAAPERPDAARDFLAYLGSADSQRTIVDEIGRLAATEQVGADALPARHQKGREFLQETGHLTQLYEFNVFDAELARTSLSNFARFFDEWQDEGTIDAILVELEEARQAALDSGS